VPLLTRPVDRELFVQTVQRLWKGLAVPATTLH
jgi:hypothetical protein